MSWTWSTQLLFPISNVKHNHDQQASKPNSKKEIHQDPFPDHTNDKKGKFKAKEKKKKKSKSKCDSSSSSSSSYFDEEEIINIFELIQKIPHYKQYTDGSKVPPDNSAEASSSNTLEE